jgi:preprotein translocase subunit SecA
MLLIQETEEEITSAGKTVLSAYKTSVGVQRIEHNAYLDCGRTCVVNVGQFFDGTAYYLGKIFTSCFPWTGGKQAVIERLVATHAMQYDIAEVHYSRFPSIFCNFLSDEPEEDLSLKIAPLIHLIARWKKTVGMTSFLMLTQPGSYKESSYAEVFECWQRLVDVYERGFVKPSVVMAFNDFYLSRIPIQKLIAIVHEAECSEFFSSTDLSFQEGDSIEVKNVYAIHDLIAGGPAKQQCNLDVFYQCMSAAKTILKDMFPLLLNPISYYHVIDFAAMKNILHLFETILQKGGGVGSFLQEFYQARLSLQGLERALEKKLSEMAGSAADEEPVDSVLGRFSHLSPSAQSSMAEEYRTICKMGEPLRNVGMNALVSHARSIQEKCQRGALLKEDLLFLLAIARESIRKHFGMYPHNTQMLALLGLLNHPKSVKGRIAQVKTGEGKSVIIAMLAVYLACQGKYIDIISSSRYLAQRDAEKYGGYFARFGISSSHLCTDSPTAANFSGQIIFSTNFDAEFSVMRDYFAETPMRTVGDSAHTKPRHTHVVIVDEVDNLFIDSALNSARIAIEGGTSIRDVYTPLFKYVQERIETLLPVLYDAALRQTKDFTEAKQIVRQCVKVPPETMELFLDERVEMLLRSAIRSIELSEGKDYIIRSVGERKEIVIVDHSNTGRLAEKSKWSHGLHQFLQVKHEVPIDEENVMPASICHPVYFGSYDCIYGLTGTIGSELERSELQKTYTVTTFDVPPHRPSLRKDLEPKVCLTPQDHCEAIVRDIEEMRAKGRPTLLLCETIQQAHEFSRYCSSHGVSSLILTACQPDDEEYIITQAGLPGKVTIATNTAGRGTDIILQKEARLAGGLHVIFTYLPANERVEQQGIGRAGRQGQPGSSRVILLVDSPILALLSSTLKSADREQLHKIGYGLFLKQRSERIAKLSAERMLRTEIERINHGYLLLFVQQFQAWIKLPNKQLDDSSSIQEKMGRHERTQQLWAEQFYSRLDELFVQVKTSCDGDDEQIVSQYKLEIQKFFEKAKPSWEKVVFGF